MVYSDKPIHPVKWYNTARGIRFTTVCLFAILTLLLLYLNNPRLFEGPVIDHTPIYKTNVAPGTSEVESV